MTSSRILVACVGNIFMGDDGFGSEVARRLQHRGLPKSVNLVDFGIRCRDLAYALLDDYNAVILVDITRQGGVCGTVYVMEPHLELDLNSNDPGTSMQTHGPNLTEALRWAKAMGARLSWVRLVGCEPVTIDPSEEGCMGLSPPVMAAVDHAADAVQQLVAGLLTEEAA